MVNFKYFIQFSPSLYKYFALGYVITDKDSLLKYRSFYRCASLLSISSDRILPSFILYTISHRDWISSL